MLLSDLPVADTSDRPAKRRHWAVSILGSSGRRTRRRVRRLISIAIMASPNIDLCHGEFDGDEIVVRGFVLWGWPDIYLPDSVGLDQGGFTLMGGDRERGSARVPPPLVRWWSKYVPMGSSAGTPSGDCHRNCRICRYPGRKAARELPRY